MAKYGTGLELVLNACEGGLQILVTENEKPLCFQEWLAPTRATEILAPALREICLNLQINPRDFRRVGCFAGPGSFVGVRLVLATAAAMRRAGNAFLASLDYAQALATSASIWRGLLYPAPIRVVLRARRDLICQREFVSYGPLIPAQPATPYALIGVDEAAAQIAASPGYVCGGGLALLEGALPPDSGAVLMPNLTRPCMESLRILGRHGDYFPRDIEPVYVRDCDAVENIDAIAVKQGEDPAKARERLKDCLERDPLDIEIY